MENDGLISVIVPVYNVEQYLDRCIQSIVDQTYRNLEIILVDDGSPDHCGAMCDAWAAKDSRIKVIHKENGGLSDARNVGLEIASGEYIAFVDSDDWIEAQMFQRLCEAMTVTASDIASCGAKRVWPDEKREQDLSVLNMSCVLDHEHAMEALITSNGLIQTVWNKLYRRNVIEGILFPVGLLYEDEFWSWQVIARATRIVTLKEAYYNYFQRDNSIMGVGFSEKSLLVIQAKTERQSYIEKAMPNLTDIGRIDLHYTCMHLGIRVLKTMRGKDMIRCMRYLKGTIKGYPIGKECFYTLTWKKRLHLRMLRLLFVPTCLIHSMRERT